MVMLFVVSSDVGVPSSEYAGTYVLSSAAGGVVLPAPSGDSFTSPMMVVVGCLHFIAPHVI